MLYIHTVHFMTFPLTKYHLSLTLYMVYVGGGGGAWSGAEGTNKNRLHATLPNQKKGMSKTILNYFLIIINAHLCEGEEG
jgi:hypothetical protein